LKAIAEYGSISMISYLGHGVVRDLRNDVFRANSLPAARFFHFNPTGELISRLSGDVDRIQTAASETLADFLKQAAILIFPAHCDTSQSIGSSLWLSLVLAPLVFYPAIWFGKNLWLLSKSNQQEMAEMANILYETVTGNRIVKAFTMEKAEVGKVPQSHPEDFQIESAAENDALPIVSVDGGPGDSGHRRLFYFTRGPRS